jgi:putative transposase
MDLAAKGIAMPRKPRMYLPEVPCHVIQRGNNRAACFFAERDYHYYLECLGEACDRNAVAVHAYVLMTNHVHLLMTPEDAPGISRVMQSIGRRYVQYINKTYQRCGTLWESRHKASLVDAEPYLLSCYRYIELNPVAANMVNHPGDYPWSSYRHNAQGRPDERLTAHPLYQRLGSSHAERQGAYRELFSSALSPTEVHAIRTAARFSMPLGNDRFREQIQQALGRSVGQAKRGRPLSAGKPRATPGEN